MSFLKWFKKKVFDWSSESPSQSIRPPVHDPGWENRQRAKRANNRLHNRPLVGSGKKAKSKSSTSSVKSAGSPSGGESEPLACFVRA